MTVTSTNPINVPNAFARDFRAVQRAYRSIRGGGSVSDRKTLDVERIVADERVLVRAAVREDTAQEYAERMQAGDEFPRPVVFFDGATFWIADGAHRLKAHRIIGRNKVDCIVREGSRTDAILFAANVNKAHGLRFNDGDKKHAVKMVLAALRERGETWTDQRVADEVGCDESWVRRIRKSEVSDSPKPHTPAKPSREQAQRGGRPRSAPRPESKPTPQTAPTTPQAEAKTAQDTPHTSEPATPRTVRSEPVAAPTKQTIAHELVTPQALKEQAKQTIAHELERTVLACTNALMKANNESASELRDYLKRNPELRERIGGYLVFMLSQAGDVVDALTELTGERPELRAIPKEATA